MSIIQNDYLEFIKVHPTKQGTMGFYQRLEFKDQNGKWYKTDTVIGFRNYARWRKVLRLGIGTHITNYIIKDELTIDADSPIKIVGDKLL